MLLFALALLAPADIAAVALVQTTPVQPIVKGTGLPLADVDEAQVMARVDAWLAAVAAGDAGAIAAQLRADGGGGATVATASADGTRTVRHLGWPQFLAAARPSPRAQFTGTPRWRSTETSPWCGATSPARRKAGWRAAASIISIWVRDGGGWKVQNVTSSQRTAGC